MLVSAALTLFALTAASAGVSAAQPLGYVVRVDSRGVYLDMGAQAGAAVGQPFEVYKEGAELKHPVTGQSLGRLETPVASGVISDVEKLYSVGTLARAADVAAGMRARLGELPAAAPAATPAAAAAPQPGRTSVRTPRWKGPELGFKIRAMAVADFLGNGQPQLALADNATIYLFPYPPHDDKPVAVRYIGGVNPRIVSLSAADLDRDGKAELFVSLDNQSLGRVETAVYQVEAGRWKKLSELPWLVHPVAGDDGKRLLAVQQLEDTDFPFSAVYPLRLKDGRYGPGRPALRHPRADWLYDFTRAKLDDGEPAFVYITSNNRIRAQFRHGAWSTEEPYEQTPVRMRWPDGDDNNGRLLEFHPEILVVPGGDRKSSLYVVRNTAMLGALAEPFGLFSSGELARMSWNGVALQKDWTAPLGGYTTATALVSRPGKPDDLVAAVTSTSGKSSIWVFDP